MSVQGKPLKVFSNPNGKLTRLVNARPHKELVYVKVILGRMLSEMKLNPYGGFKILQCLFQIIDQVPLLEMKYHIVIRWTAPEQSSGKDMKAGKNRLQCHQDFTYYPQSYNDGVKQNLWSIFWEPALLSASSGLL